MPASPFPHSLEIPSGFPHFSLPICPVTEKTIYRDSRSTLVAEFTNVSVCEPVSPELSAKLPISTGEI